MTPTHREFDLVVGFGFEVEYDVDGAVLFVGLDVGHEVFGVEVSGLSDFAQRAHEVGLAEQFAGFDAEFAAYDFFVEAVVAVDDDVVDTCLRTFHDAHFQGDAVAFDVFFDGYELEEEVSVVHIQRVDCIVVGAEAFVHVLLVVHVAGLHSEDVVEYGVGVYGVAYPVDVFDVVAFAFVDGDVYVDEFFVVGHDAVADDDGVAVSFFVIFFDDSVEVVLVVLFDEFFLAEEVYQLVFFVGFLHCALDLVGREDLVAGDVYFVYFDFAAFVYGDVYDHLVAVAEVFVQCDFDFGVTEAFVGEVFASDAFDTVDDVLCDLVAFHQLQRFLEVFAFAFFHSDVVDFGNTGLGAQFQFEPCFVAVSFEDFDASLSEEALSHESFDGVTEFVAGDFEAVADFETCVSEDDEVFVCGSSGDLDICDFVCARHSAEHHCGVVNGVGGVVGGLGEC